MQSASRAVARSAALKRGLRRYASTIKAGSVLKPNDEVGARTRHSVMFTRWAGLVWAADAARVPAGGARVCVAPRRARADGSSN